MKLDATPETVRAVAEVFKFAAFLDDRLAGADRGRIAAWAEQVQRHDLGREDMLDGLQMFYDGPSSRAIGVGDLIHHSKLCRRDRTEREDEALRMVREEEHEAKAAEDITAISASVLMGSAPPTPRLQAARDSLQSCRGRRESVAAIREFSEAKRAARKAS